MARECGPKAGMVSLPAGKGYIWPLGEFINDFKATLRGLTSMIFKGGDK